MLHNIPASRQVGTSMIPILQIRKHDIKKGQVSWSTSYNWWVAQQLIDIISFSAILFIYSLPICELLRAEPPLGTTPDFLEGDIHQGLRKYWMNEWMNVLNICSAAAWIFEIRQVNYSPAQVSLLLFSVGLKDVHNRWHLSSQQNL